MIKLFQQAVLALILLLAATGCADTAAETSTTAAATPVSTTTTSTAAPQISTTASILEEANGFDLFSIVEDFVGTTSGGVVALIARNGEWTVAAVGDADATGRALTRQTPFRVGSISKPFVATMILQMVDEGSVDLDEPLGTYLPDAPLGTDITVRQLLSHQSGLPNYTSDPAFFLAMLEDFTRSYMPEDILEFVTDSEPGPTGTFEYSNTNYILLGMLVEQIDGVPLNDSLQNRIAGPWGLASTSFVGRGVADPEGIAAFWSFGLNTGLTDIDYESVASAAWAAGSLVSTVDDLATFMKLLFEGDLLPAQQLTEMTDTGEFGYGLGWFAAQLGTNNPGFAHNGSIPGFSSSMGLAPASGDLVVVLTNNDTLVADRLVEQIVSSW